MPMQDVFEGSSIALIARGPSENWTGKKVTFEIVQTGRGDKVPNKDDTFEGFLVRYDIDKLPKVHDDDVNYVLEYKVTVDGDTRISSNAYTVWPKVYDIEAVNEDNTKGKFAEFDVGGGNNRGRVTLNSDGQGHYSSEAAGAAPTFEVRSPYELVRWDKAVGRKRKAKVKRKPYTAEFFEPVYGDIPSGLRFTSTAVPSAQGFYQVVNLDGADSPCYGPEILFKVGASGDRIRVGTGRYGKKDDVIHVKVEFDANNSPRNDDPKPGVHQKLGDPLVAAHTTATQTFTVKLGENGAPGEFKVVVGAAGGDKIKVSIGVTSACQDASYEIKTDRRVFYQVTRNAGQENPDLTRAEAALGKVGVTLSRYKVVSLQPSDKPPNCVSWIAGAYFGSSSPRLNVGNYNSAFYHNKWSNRDPKQKVVSPRLHVLYTDLQYDSYDPAVTGNPQDSIEVTGQELVRTDTVAWSDGSSVVGVRFNIPMADAGLFDKRLYDGSSPFVGGTWRRKGTGVTGAFSATDVWMATDHLTVKLPAACAPILAGGGTIQIVSLVLARARGPYLGEASNRKILCVVTQTTREINDTLTHEVGHVIGLAPGGTAPPGLVLTNHNRRYTGNQHQGPHCAKGMSDINFAGGTGAVSTDYHLNFGGKPECTCVMYGEISATSSGKFCDLCEPFGKAGKIV